MKVTVNQFLRAAKENGHSLNTLISLTEKFSHLNPEMVLIEIPEVNFNELTDLPGIESLDLYVEASRKYTEQRNVELGLAKDTNLPGKKL